MSGFLNFDTRMGGIDFRAGCHCDNSTAVLLVGMACITAFLITLFCLMTSDLTSRAGSKRGPKGDA